LAETGIHRGSCHCGSVRFEMDGALAPVLDCNCSYCTKRGTLWAHVGPEQFRLLSGEDQLADYQFNHKVIHHLFCKVCGVSPFGRGQDETGALGYGINVRCLDDVDVRALELTFYDGKSR
jgi:hypothetical protein